MNVFNSLVHTAKWFFWLYLLPTILNTWLVLPLLSLITFPVWIFTSCVILLVSFSSSHAHSTVPGSRLGTQRGPQSLPSVLTVLGRDCHPRDADDSAQLSEGGAVPRARAEGVSLVALEQQQHSYQETGWFQASCSLWPNSNLIQFVVPA